MASPFVANGYEALKELHKKHDLDVQLLSDESGALCEAYGVWGLKKFMGRESMGIIRSTFVIDKSGVIREIYSSVRVKGHADAVLKKVKTDNVKYFSHI